MKLGVDVEVGDMGAGKDTDGPSKPFVVVSDSVTP